MIGGYLSDARIESRVALADWKDRTTSGEARVIELAIGNGCKGNAIAFGGELNIKIHARFDVTLIDPSFGVVVHDFGGTPLLHMRSVHDGFRVGRVSGNIIVEMNIPRLDLYPGRYLLSVLISDRSVPKGPGFCSALFHNNYRPSRRAAWGPQTRSQLGEVFRSVTLEIECTVLNKLPSTERRFLPSALCQSLGSWVARRLAIASSMFTIAGGTGARSP